MKGLRFQAFVIAGLLSFALLAGCTGHEATEPPSSTDSVGTTSATTAVACYTGTTIPDFGAVTGRDLAERHDEAYIYAGCTTSDMETYMSALSKAGFSRNSSLEQRVGGNVYVFIKDGSESATIPREVDRGVFFVMPYFF